MLNGKIDYQIHSGEMSFEDLHRADLPPRLADMMPEARVDLNKTLHCRVQRQ